MKAIRNFILICFVCSLSSTYSQVQWNYVSSSGGKCVDVYDGIITFSITGASPPFTAVITNTAGCAVANPTVTSTTAQITFTGIPGCTSFYYLSLYNSSNNLISSFQTSFGVYSSTPFSIAIASSTAATCSSCCNGSAYPSWSGGSFSMPGSTPLFYLDNVYLANNFFPMTNICPGTHTLCANDNVGCQKCITFVMPGNVTGISGYGGEKESLGVYPNPAGSQFGLTYKDMVQTDVIEVLSITGQQMIKQFVSSNYNEIHVQAQNLVPGIYIVKLISAENTVKATAKIVKE